MRESAGEKESEARQKKRTEVGGRQRSTETVLQQAL